VLRAFLNSFRVPDLRNKIFFTLFIIAIYRFGSHVPVPVVDVTALQNSSSTGFLALIDLFSGGALTNVSVFSLGIMPYITSTIIMQLLTVVIPKLAQWQEQGETGTKKINQYTRYLTVVLAVLQATGLVFLFHSGQLGADVFPPNTFDTGNVLLIVLVMTAGTALIMWLSELITQRGVGNGMSLLIFTSIISRLPAEGGQIFRTGGWFALAVVLLMGVGIVMAVVFMDQGQRRVPIQYAKRVVGRKMTTGASTYLPLKVNQAGVIPVIFGSSLLYLPDLISRLAGTEGGAFQRFVQTYLVDQSNWLHIILYIGLIIFFTYFYVGITFNPDERADEMKKFGGFIPGIRPGRPTADYLNFVLSRITLPGSLYLGLVAVVPNLFLDLGGSGGGNLPFGGTSVLIMVSVGLDTVKQIESQLMQRNYEGFLK